ncbi:LytTR family transcriptional regulator DNA-binding domain-containing protein [Spirosoma aerophilum]
MNLITRAGAHHRLTPDQIIAITGDTNYSYVHLITGERLHRSRPILFFSKMFPDFLRIHKKALINPTHVSHYNLPIVREPNGYVVMRNDLRLEVSRRRVQQVGQVLSCDC